jgi:hypothetical protein
VLAGYALESTPLEGTETQQAIDLNQHNRQISFGDASALVLARSRHALLLTGDGPLRKLALDGVCQAGDSVGETLRWRVRQKPTFWLKRDVARSSNPQSALN